MLFLNGSFLIKGFNNLIGNIHIIYIDNTRSISLSSTGEKIRYLIDTRRNILKSLCFSRIKHRGVRLFA